MGIASHAMGSKGLPAAIRKLLPPLVRILLRNGMSAKCFYEITKDTYVTVARNEFGIGKKQATISRIAILTGLTRKEVQALLDMPVQSADRYGDEYNRAARGISGWVRGPGCGDVSAHPRPLRMGGRRQSFSALVKRYSGDIPVRAMLDELVRVGAVKQLKDGRIGVAVRGYIPQKGADQKLAVLGQDTADLIATIDHNIYGNPSGPRVQRKVVYDNVPAESAQAFQVVAQARTQEMLESLDRWLSHRDRDVNPTVKGKGRLRVGLGVYHFEERLDQDG